MKAALEGKLKPLEEVVHLGRAVVRETFKISKVGTIAGCYVTRARSSASAQVRVIREGVVVYPPAEKVVGLDTLKRFKDDVREVREGLRVRHEDHRLRRHQGRRRDRGLQDRSPAADPVRVSGLQFGIPS